MKTKRAMRNKIMPKQVHAALTVLLEEFGSVDLDPRLEYFAGDDPEEGRKLLRAWNLVATRHDGGDLNFAAIQAEADKSFSEVYLRPRRSSLDEEETA